MSVANQRTKRVSSTIYRYMVTIAKCQKLDYVEPFQLNNVMLWLKLRLSTLNVDDFTFENDGKYRQLHMHSIVTVKRPVYYKYNNKHNGFYIDWKPITDLEGAYRYIHKHAYNKYEQENIITDNYIRHNYMF